MEFSICECSLNGVNYFTSGIFQNYLVFIPAKKYIKYFSGTTWIDSWKSNGMSEESIENITKSGSNFATTFAYHQVLPYITITGHCLINNNISIPKKVINISIYLSIYLYIYYIYIFIYILHTKSMVKKLKLGFYI